MSLIYWIFWIFWGFVHLCIICYLYKKANEHGLSGIIWALGGLFLHVFGLLLFVYLTSEKDHVNTGNGASVEAEHAVLRFPGDPAPEPVISESTDEFHDGEIEKLMEEKRFNDARKLLIKMLKVARDMKDEDAVADYRQYDARIDEAEKLQDGGW